MLMNDVIYRVEKLLEKARPYLEQDGGNVELVRWDSEHRTIELRLTGNCADCPLAMMTLRAGLERLILNTIPEVHRIEKVK